MNIAKQNLIMKRSKLLRIQGFLFLLFVLFIIPACENKENYEFEDSPIINAYLYADNYFEVQISHQVPFSEDATFVENTDNLDITVSRNGDQSVLESMGSGIYADTLLIVDEDDEYTMDFVYNGNEISAYTYVPAKPTEVTQSATQIYIERIDSTSIPGSGGPGSMPDPIEITWENGDESYYLLVVENMASELDPIRDFGDEDAPERLFRNAPTNSSVAEIRAFDFQYYGQHRIILYHVLPDYASLYEMSESNSQNITNPSTSINNGYGIFTGLNSDTLYVNVKED